MSKTLTQAENQQSTRRAYNAVVKRTYHGMNRTPIHRIWIGMIQRCTNPKSTVYRHYGGRGIKVCERWRLSFLSFYEDMGEKPEGMSLDRINNDGNYEPGNCRWATPLEQVLNRRKRTHCPNGHAYQPSNVWVMGNGTQRCKTCSRANKERHENAIRGG